MDPLLISLRVVHVACGVYWAGTLLFFTTFLEPSLRALGPDGGKVMIKFFERGYLTLLPVIALLAIVSGIWLLAIASGGFEPDWMGSGPGIAFSSGGLAAIVGFLLGVAVMRPTALKIWALSKQVAQAPDDAARAPLMAQMGALRARTVLSARVIAVLLLVAVVLMAVGRYV